MTRLISARRAEPVEVRRRDDAPEQFLWGGRLYVVRAVLARWTESGGWWRGTAVRNLIDGSRTDGSRPDGSRPDGSRPDGSRPDGSRPDAAGPALLDDGERDWWRVEADSGRLAAMSAGPGVYDLCFHWSRGAWSLARVLD